MVAVLDALRLRKQTSVVEAQPNTCGMAQRVIQIHEYLESGATKCEPGLQINWYARNVRSQGCVRYFISISIPSFWDDSGRTLDPKTRNAHVKELVWKLFRYGEQPDSFENDFSFAIHMYPHTHIKQDRMGDHFLDTFSGEITLEVIGREDPAPNGMPVES